MDINRFTESVQQALGSAQSKAARYGNQQVDVEHLLASLLEQERGLAVSILNKAEINSDALEQRVEQELQRLPKVSGPAGAPDQIYITGRLNRLLAQAEDEAREILLANLEIVKELAVELQRGPMTGAAIRAIVTS